MNEEPRDPTLIASKSAPDKAQPAIGELASKNAVTTKTAALPVSLGETKTPSETKPSGNTSSNTNKETHKSSSQTEPESDDSQPELTQLPPNGLQIAPAAANQDDSEQRQSGRDSGKRETQESDQIDATGSLGSNPIQGDLALAMRISSTGSDPSQSQGQNDTSDAAALQAAAGQHNQTQLAGAVEPQQRHEIDSTARTAGAITATQPSVLRETEKASQPEEGKSTHSADFEAEFNKFRSEPVRGAQVQITGAENQRVDIRLQERAGTLSVSVRSNDSALTRTLQDHSPELSARLSAEHFRTELWAPSLNKTPQDRGSNANSGQGQQQSEAQRQQGQGRKGRQNQTPEWITELENDPAAFQKRIEYTWHQ